jgi:hypothetical protein
MNDSPPTLGSLPVEILGSMFRLLDPIGLISTSQTNSKFRSIIQPSRTHILERLLKLECGEEGGGTPIFRAKDNHLDPKLTSEQWNGMRWACSICLKLLPQTAYDNHYLLRLQYRKPLPGSSAANPFTSWEPTKDGKLSISQLQHMQQPDRKEVDRKIRRRYDLAVKKDRWGPNMPPRDLCARLKTFQDSGMITFQGLNQDQYWETTEEEERVLLDHEARLIERERCGFKRHLRKCNECRFQRREISTRTVDSYGEAMKRGTTKVPIVPSRHLPFASALDRYFPAIATILDNKRPIDNAPVQRVYRKKAVDSLWAMYMVRCPGCSLWQEERAFRFGGNFHHWTPTSGSQSGFRNWDNNEVTPSLIESLRCNHCYAKEHGREALGKVLTKWLDCCFTNERSRLGYLLLGGWERLSRQYEREEKLSNNSDIKSVVLGVQQVVEKVGKNHDYCQITLDDISTLKLRFREWVSVWENLGFEARKELNYNPWDELWHENYDLIEAHLIWVMSSQMEMTNKGDVLVDWVLSRDSRALM